MRGKTTDHSLQPHFLCVYASVPLHMSAHYTKLFGVWSSSSKLCDDWVMTMYLLHILLFFNFFVHALYSSMSISLDHSSLHLYLMAKLHIEMATWVIHLLAGALPARLPTGPCYVVLWCHAPHQPISVCPYRGIIRSHGLPRPIREFCDWQQRGFVVTGNRILLH